MAKTTMFSRKFPSYHPKAGSPTFFVEKILNQQGVNYSSEEYLQKLLVLNTVNIFKGKLSFEDIESFHLSLQPQEDCKSHTIRAGNRIIPGDMFSPRCWFGKPYKSPQIIFWDEIEVKKTWDFKMEPTLWFDECKYFIEGQLCFGSKLATVAKNDGLKVDDFLCWFSGKDIADSNRKPFKGQVICWNPLINY